MIFARSAVYAALTAALLGMAPVAQAQQLPDSDADLLDFRQAQNETSTTWVDPRIANRKRCFDRPGRPEWVVNQPRGDDWRRLLAEVYVHLQGERQIVENEECTCDNVYPDYEEYRDEIDALLGQFPITRSEFEEEDFDLLNDLRGTMTKRRGRMAAEVGRLCRGL